MPTDDPPRPADDAVAGLDGEPHRRYNALTGEWVLVSAGRTRRPWLGAEEPEPPEERPAYDPACYLCPGNTRVNGDVNPAYAGHVRVHQRLRRPAARTRRTPRVGDGLFRAEGDARARAASCASRRATT